VCCTISIANDEQATSTAIGTATVEGKKYWLLTISFCLRVDAVMIGRATFGCPWIFSRQELTLDEKIDVLEEQLRINIERCDTEEIRKSKKSAELCGILHTRRHLAASPVFKGIPNFRETRIQMLRAEKKDDLLAILERCRETLK
jgi:tRNA-dihydrouridine synthase